MTLSDKLTERRKYVKASFAFMVLLPFISMCLLVAGIDPSPIGAIFATASATFSAIIIGHMATTPSDKGSEDV